MQNPETNESPLDAERLREIPLWARRYASNRSLPFLVNWVIFVLAFVVFGALPCGAYWAYRAGLWPLAIVALVLLVGFAAFWLWYSFRGALVIVPYLADRLYGKEGSATPKVTRERPRVGQWPGLLFVGAILAHVVLSFLGLLPERWMQPISALYVIPFVVWLIVVQWPRISPFLLLWPALYVIHAGLVLAGAPIQFGGGLSVLNMVLPTMGYGLIAGLAGHLYSRYALCRLRQAAGVAPQAEPNGGGSR